MHNSLKYLVLKLLSLESKERQWILDRLSTTERDRVNGLLNEAKLVIDSADSELIAHAVAELEDSAQFENSGNEDNTKQELRKLIKKIDKYSAQEIYDLLADEEIWILTAVMSLYQWSWLENFENTLPYHVKAKINQSLRDADTDVRNDFATVILKLIIDSRSDEAGQELNGIINFDNYEEFKHSQLEGTSKTWWGELWQS